MGSQRNRALILGSFGGVGWEEKIYFNFYFPVIVSCEGKSGQGLEAETMRDSCLLLSHRLELSPGLIVGFLILDESVACFDEYESCKTLCNQPSCGSQSSPIFHLSICYSNYSTFCKMRFARRLHFKGLVMVICVCFLHQNVAHYHFSVKS